MSRKTSHLPIHDTELFCRQVVEGEKEPPVEVSLTPQGAVVDISLLLVSLVPVYPANRTRHHSTCIYTVNTMMDNQGSRRYSI